MEKTVKPPLWQKAIGVIIGTAIGGIIYGIFLEALLIQSLIIDRRPLDPAQWQTGLSGRAWICGALLFATLFFVPFRFLTRAEGSSVFSDINQGGLVWFLIGLIFLIQIATVVYARMRPELCTIEHPVETFSYGKCRRRKPLAGGDEWDRRGGRRHYAPCFTLSYSLSSWKNGVQFIIIGIEFFQLFSLAINKGVALQSAGVSLLSSNFLRSLANLKNAAWQFGMSDGGSFDTSFGLLCGFSGLYIFLCGVFIALDLTVDSPLSPLLFTLLAGGFYGTVTAGLLYVILYSPVAAYVLVCLLMLAYYSSTAVFVSIYRSDAKKIGPGEIRLMPLFTALERVLKGVLAGISVVLKDATPTVGAIVALVFLFAFLALLLLMRPYSVRGVNLLRMCSIGVCGWTAFLTLMASFLSHSESGSILSGFLLLGWIGIPCLVGLLTKVWDQMHAKPAIVQNPIVVSERFELILVPVATQPLGMANN